MTSSSTGTLLRMAWEYGQICSCALLASARSYAVVPCREQVLGGAGIGRAGSAHRLRDREAGANRAVIGLGVSVATPLGMGGGGRRYHAG